MQGSALQQKPRNSLGVTGNTHDDALIGYIDIYIAAEIEQQ